VLSSVPQLQVRQQSFVFEATQTCNHDCLHCYNVWKNPIDYPQGELPTDQTLEMLDKMVVETGASLVSLSGGEPLLRRDIHDIVDHLSAKGLRINLLTNGSLLNDETAEALAGKIELFELPLLSVDAGLHDRLSGSTGAFEGAVRAIASLKATQQRVICVFVATSLNLPTWRETAELAIALGADGVLFNRFNPGGAGRQNIASLQATPEALRRALDIAEEITRHYRVPISCSIPMPPCLFDHAQWPGLGFGFCAAGTEKAYYTLDPLGNVRPCNHSPTILGNIRTNRFAHLVRSDKMLTFVSARPEFCDGCRLEQTCLGGCKASAEVCSGAPNDLDPFVAAFRKQAQKC
jgi:radical SAM protein with 4Fe4S-binding SPASM domain